MNETKAGTLAHVLGGDMLLMPYHGGHAVGLTRPDGGYAMFQDARGAVFADDIACLADHPGESVAFQWDGWGLGESWATALATLIGGQAHHRGGDIWVVLLQRSDGRFAVIGAEEVEVYPSRQHYANCQSKPKRFDWEW